jgi:hypothetical protein
VVQRLVSELVCSISSSLKSVGQFGVLEYAEYIRSLGDNSLPQIGFDDPVYGLAIISGMAAKLLCVRAGNQDQSIGQISGFNLCRSTDIRRTERILSIPN